RRGARAAAFAHRVPGTLAGARAALRAAPVRARAAAARRSRGPAAVALPAALHHTRHREGTAPRRAGSRRGHEPRGALGAAVERGSGRRCRQLAPARLRDRTEGDTMRDPQALISTEELSTLLDRPSLRIYDCTTYLETPPPGIDDPYVAVPGRRTF